MKLARCVLTAVVAALISALPVCAQTWKVANDFSPTQNPNGVWSYGSKTILNGDFACYNSVFNENSTIYVWCQDNNTDTCGNVCTNTGSDPIESNGMWWEPVSTRFHPGANKGYCAVRWTAPSSCIVRIDATFSGMNFAQGTTTDVHVLHNTDAIYNGTINGFAGGGTHAEFGTSPKQDFSGMIFVGSGDTIDFEVGAGGNGIPYDLTGLDAAITAMPDYGMVSGKVFADTASKPVLSGATVRTADGSVSTTTASDGSYSIVVPQDTQKLVVSYPHTATQSAAINVTANSVITKDFYLVPGDGNTYYVSPDGNDSNDGKSLQSAWKNINCGDTNGLLQPGDTVIVAAGTYVPADFGGISLSKCSGTSDSPILYKANGHVLIDMSSVPRSDKGVSYGFFVDANGITIDGFEIKGGQWGIYFNDGRSFNSAIGNTVHGIRVGDPSQQGWNGWCGGICNSVSTGNLNRNNVVYDIGSPALSNWAVCIASPASTNLRILNNTLASGGYGLLVWSYSGDNHQVCNNIITGMRTIGISEAYSGVSNFTHSHNLFYGNSQDLGAGLNLAEGEFNADPQFADGQNGNFSLSASSPAIDKGIDVGLPFYGSNPDIGALEYTSVVTATRIGAIKSLPDSTEVVVTEPKVVCSYSGTYQDGSVYIEDADRAAGIRAVATAGLPKLSLWDRIAFKGTVRTDANGERYIYLTSINSQAAGSEIRPFGIAGGYLWASTGLCPTAILVNTWGWVTSRASDGSSFYLQNGVKVDLSGLVVPSSKALTNDNYVIVTGFVSTQSDGSRQVKVIRPRGDDDIYIVKIDWTPSQLMHRWTDAHLGRSSSARPYSFIYNGQLSSDLLSGWKCDYAETILDSNRTQKTVTYTDPDTGLEVRCVAVEYSDFPTVEWTVYFKNNGSVDTPILQNILSLDTIFTRDDSREYVLHTNIGSPCTNYDYEPIDVTLTPGSTQHYGGAGGRPTNAYWPYYNLEYADGGAIVVVGWPGQWAADFTRDNGYGLNIKAGQELTHLSLHPGEEIRTPLMVVQFYKGDRIDSQNTWRRWMLAHSMPKPGGQLPPPHIAACSSHSYAEMINANEDNQKMFIDRYLEEGIQLDYWWMDAGWYINDGTWPNVGTWEVDPVRFPNGLRAITDYGHSKGVNSIVWFEPERVTANTWITNNHPEWVIGGAGGGLLNLGNPDAWNWLVNHIDGLLTDQGIDLYRQDFNMDPLGYWRGNDADNRQGITENFHVQGYLAYWDELKRRHPDMLIDSCASGGRRNDLETMRRAVPLLRSDYIFEPMGQQNHTYGIASWLPFYGTGIQGMDSYSFRSCMTPGLNLSYEMRDTSLNYASARTLVSQWRQVAQNYFGDYYPLTAYSTNSNVWIAWQFNRPDTGTGMVQAFRRADETKTWITLKLRGLDSSAKYTLSNPDTGQSWGVTGSTLMNTGLTISLTTQPADALITYKKQ